MALDLGLATRQLLSALDGVADAVRDHGHRLTDTLERAQTVPADQAAFRTAAVGRRPYISARTGPEGLLGSIAPPEVPQDWTAVSVDGSHIDVDRHLPLRCHLINLGGCAITYGRNSGCQLFSEPSLAVEDDDLYLRPPDGASGETLIAGPLLGALRTVREVERLADAVASLPHGQPVLALLDGTLAFWDLQRGQYPPLRRRPAHRRPAQLCPGPPARGFPGRSPGGRGRLHLPAPHRRGGRRRASNALRPARRRLQPPLHRPPFPAGPLQPRRGFRRP